MTIRAVVIGICLALLIACSTYFNDWVIGQTLLIGNHLPISVFGIAVLLLLCVNPLLFKFNAKLPLRASEIGIIVALGLAVCGWPGSSFFRGFATITAYPAHWLKTKANWQSAHVMSYVPGASAEFGQGHVQDWQGLAGVFRQLPDNSQASPASRVWSLLPEPAQRSFTEGIDKGFDPGRTAELTFALNTVLAQPALYDAKAFAKTHVPNNIEPLLKTPVDRLGADEVVLRNRWLMVGAFPDFFLPPPRGQGVLFDRGRADPFALDTLVHGRAKNQQLSLSQLPWRKWWPTIRVWCGSALLLSLVALCMALVVHPQWSKRELLPYPVARLIDEVSARREGSGIPDIARNKLFWLGFTALFLLHLVNGLHAWFQDIPEIPRKFEFWALTELFPNGSRVYGSWGYFAPTVYGSVIAFSYFLSSSVAFSLGVSELLYMAFAGTLLGYGVQVDSGFPDGTGASLMRFGSFVAAALMILYTGRRYYANVMSSAVGLSRAPETPKYATWGARFGALAVILTVAVLHSAGIGIAMSVAFIALELVIFLVLSRMVAETGTFFVQTFWAPVGALTALLGFDAIGPTTYIALSVGATVLFSDSRELLMPFLVNALKLTDRSDGPTPTKVAPWLAIIVAVGLGVAGCTTLLLQYNHGATQVGNPFATDYLPMTAFDGLAQRIAAATASGTMTLATAAHGLQRFALIRPDSGAPLWVSLGLCLGVGTAIARLRWSWWPIHPVVFLTWGTYPIYIFGPSFLLGWMLKSAVVNTTGARGYHQIKPLMVGVFAGELACGLFWMLVGAGYYCATGKAPVAYSIFPT
jgi:hypothetical protein